MKTHNDRSNGILNQTWSVQRLSGRRKDNSITLTENQGGASNERPNLKGGRVIDVCGHRLYICTSGTGSPAVLMEPGMGVSTSAYGWLEQGTASFTAYCLYDRAGLGRSEESGQKGVMRRWEPKRDVTVAGMP
jgi:hypothetical protein